MKHKFLHDDYDNWINTLIPRDTISYNTQCIYCNKIAGFLFKSLSVDLKNAYVILKYNGTSKIIDCINFYNEHAPCLTDDEYIIKTIIE